MSGGALRDQPVAEIAIRLEIPGCAGTRGDGPKQSKSSAFRRPKQRVRPKQTTEILPLPVIPHLEITDMGLVDVDRFQIRAGLEGLFRP